MEKSAVKADLSAPNPLATVEPPPKEPPAPAPANSDAAPRPGALDGAPKGEADGLDAEDAPPAAADAPTAADAPPESEADKALAAQLAGKDGKKVSPWKLVKDFKQQLAESHKLNLDLQNRLAAASKADEAVKRAADIEKRNVELEEEIRYHNYAKSQEFADKYAKPYEEAFIKADSEIKQLNMTLEDGSVRKATTNDMIALANMPLDQIDDAAERLFGKSAPRVIRHVERLRDLSDAQAKALNESRKASAERTEKFTATQQAIVKETSDLWATTNAAIAAKSEFLRPKEGDDEWNGTLDKSAKLIDAAWNANAFDPRHTPEQRQDIVRKQAAAKNRAIAYGPLKVQVARLTKQLADAQKELAEFKASGTVNGDGAGKTNGADAPRPANAMDAARQRMQKAAIPLPAGTYL